MNFIRVRKQKGLREIGKQQEQNTKIKSPVCISLFLAPRILWPHTFCKLYEKNYRTDITFACCWVVCVLYTHTLLCVISHSYNNINIYVAIYFTVIFLYTYISPKSTKRQQCTGLYGEGVFNGRSSFFFTLFYFCFPFLCCIFSTSYFLLFFFFTFTDAYLISRLFTLYRDTQANTKYQWQAHTCVCMQCKH